MVSDTDPGVHPPTTKDGADDGEEEEEEEEVQWEARGVEEIRNHAFFQDMDWDQVLQKAVDPPFVPKFKEIPLRSPEEGRDAEDVLAEHFPSRGHPSSRNREEKAAEDSARSIGEEWSLVSGDPPKFSSSPGQNGDPVLSGDAVVQRTDPKPLLGAAGRQRSASSQDSVITAAAAEVKDPQSDILLDLSNIHSDFKRQPLRQSPPVASPDLPVIAQLNFPGFSYIEEPDTSTKS